MATCQDSCPSCPGEVCQLCAVLCGSLCPLASGDVEQVGSGSPLGWAHCGLTAAAAFPSLFCWAILSQRHVPLMFSPAAACICTCCSSRHAVKSSCSRLSLSLVLQLDTSCSPCLELSRARAALRCVTMATKERCSPSLAAVEVGREPSPVLPGNLMAALLPHRFLGVLPEVH